MPQLSLPAHSPASAAASLRLASWACWSGEALAEVAGEGVASLVPPLLLLPGEMESAANLPSGLSYLMRCHSSLASGERISRLLSSGQGRFGTVTNLILPRPMFFSELPREASSLRWAKPVSVVSELVAALRNLIRRTGLGRVPAQETLEISWEMKYCWRFIRPMSAVGAPSPLCTRT